MKFSVQQHGTPPHSMHKTEQESGITRQQVSILLIKNKSPHTTQHRCMCELHCTRRTLPS
jgi:hypothetical protein